MKLILIYLLLGILPINSSNNRILDINLEQKTCQFSSETLVSCIPSINTTLLMNSTRSIILRNAKLLLVAREKEGGQFYGNIMSLKIFQCGEILLSKEGFSALKNAKNIDIRNNVLDRIVNFTFFGLGQLVELDLSQNNLQVLEQQAFSGLSSLEKLDLSSNNLKTVPNNLFHKLPLEELYLRNNTLQTIQRNIFDKSSKLKVLDLSYNKLSTFDVLAFDAVQKLRILYLPYNNIRELQGDMRFSELTFFHAQHNKISNISNTFFIQCMNLVDIDLSYNHLYNLTEAPFRTLKNLRLLNIKENRLNNDFKQLKQNTLVVL